MELLIASTVFSVILLLVTTGIIQIGRTYYKGALQSRTQETARNIIDEISRGIQFSGIEVVPRQSFDAAAEPYPQVGGRYGFCVNNIGYAYILDKQLAASVVNTDQRSKTLVSYNRSCIGYSAPDIDIHVGGKELLGIGMRLTKLDVHRVVGTTDLYTVTVEVASGDRDLFTPPSPLISNGCRGGAGGQFCAISRLTVTVQKRVQ